MVRSLDMNPVYQSLRMALSQADADLAAIRGQMNAQQSVIGQLRGRVQAVPEVEAELVRLNRDYEINKKQYDTLVQRLESARLSEQAEQSTDNVKFRVIEPPVLPVKPSGPPRKLLTLLVLAAAAAAGLGVAVLMVLLHPTVASRSVLEKIAGIPVVGTISSALRPDQLALQRRQMLLVGAAVSSLLFICVLNLLLSEPLRALLRSGKG
jgi:polysaccharide chain length determinant protein (PEP-CTERM system associated)